MTNTSYLPDNLEISVGGYPGPFYSVKWYGQRLHYEGRGDEYVVLGIVPHPRTWKAFWEAMDRINAYKWRQSYVDLEILDGTSWSVRWQINGKIIQSSGSNAFPGETRTDVNCGIPEKAFPMFCKAVRNLTKQKFD